MNPALPVPLADALEALAEGRSGRDLAERAQAISALYRSGAPSSRAIRDEADALAYALTRMPATYAAVRAALESLAERAPDFSPRTVADIGCGPGTASWAVADVYPYGLDLRLFDSNRALMDLAIGLLGSNEGSGTYEVHFGGLAEAWIPDSELVVAAYVLTEMPDGDVMTLAQKLWAATTGALVLVEPGTPAGWARLMMMRSKLIDVGGLIAAPCPHHATCPILPPDWCHFSQRLPRSRAHRLAKGADAPFEDEKFAYLAVVRSGVALELPRTRVLAPPVEDKAAVSLKLCEPSGELALRRIAKRDKDAYRAVRRAGWGDAVE
jgi:ribosomal protein RSM22 (predicted rRNA methylase)